MGKNGLISYFDEVMGNDIHNSKIVKIKMVFSKHNARPNDCVFITDTLGDMREAASCDVSSIGVTWGYHKKENLLKGNPYQIAENPENLHEIITNYFK
jgi:phosphoglycolate phosphatase